MNWRGIVRHNISEWREIGLILLWVVLYFNVCRFAGMQSFAQRIPLVWKLASFFALLLASLYVANQGYRAVLTQTPWKYAGAVFSIVFVLSMIFASVCADRHPLFLALSVSIYGFDRLLYYVAYRKKFHRNQLVRP